MTFQNWIFSEYAEIGISNNLNGAWKLPHILVLLLTIGITVAIALLLRKKSERVRYTTIFAIAFLILLCELSRRSILFVKADSYGEKLYAADLLWIILPRPWCAISCWLLIASPFVHKKWFYNLTAMNAFLCALIFFAYPTSAGFNSKIYLFENYYSIITHMLLMIGSVSLITLKMTDFKYVEEGGTWKKSSLRELIALVCVFLYATILVVSNIEKNPLYFMPTGDYVLSGSKVHISNDVMDIVGLPSGVFLVVYVLFLALYFNAYYLIQKYHTQIGNAFKAIVGKVKGLLAKKAESEETAAATEEPSQNE